MIVFDDKIMLKRIISGGQTGADQAGLCAAKQNATRLEVLPHKDLGPWLETIL